MTTAQLARVDGLPAVLLERERIFPAPAGRDGHEANGRTRLSAKQKARVERDAAAVHTAVLPRSMRMLLNGREPVVGTFFAAAGLAEEDAEIRAALAAGGLL